MASRFTFDRDLNQVLFEAKPCIRKIILNRPQNFNCLTHEMISQMVQALEEYEHNSEIKLVVIKGQGKAFSAGGDVTKVVQMILAGHWTYALMFYAKQLMLDILIATYQKPIVCIINGIVMGGGVGLSMHGRFRIVTENTVFAMPEVLIGHFPDVGVSHFLSKLPGYFGEYLGLTGSQIDGAEMLACGLATHFVLSNDIERLENVLYKAVTREKLAISDVIAKFAHIPNLKKDSICNRVDIIDKCFSKKTMEEILSSLEEEAARNNKKWITDAVRSIKSASPTSLKLCLKIIREARSKTFKECLARDYTVSAHVVRRTINSDFFEGARAIFFDKDKRPKWQPTNLGEVNDEMIEQFFTEINDKDQEDVKHPIENILMRRISKL